MAGAPQRPPQPGAAGPGPDRRKNPQPPPAPAAEPPVEKGGGRRSAMLPAIVIAVALLGAAFLLKGGGGGEGTNVATTPTTEAVTAQGDPAKVVTLDPVTLNLADGSLAKVGIAIEVKSAATLDEIGDQPANFGAKALDELIELLGERRAEDVQAKGGKAKIKEELTKRVREAYHGEVVAVYFTELVIP